jgi:hypothetical protein
MNVKDDNEGAVIDDDVDLGWAVRSTVVDSACRWNNPSFIFLFVLFYR